MLFPFRELQKMPVFNPSEFARSVWALPFLFLILGPTGITPQEISKKGFGLGFHVQQFQRDFGLGLQITSPHFLKEKIAVRARINLAWHEHATSYNTFWTSYPAVQLGLVGMGGMVGSHIRLYGEGGILALWPSQEFSTKDRHIGGYGFFGFEFFMNSTASYFIELGGIGIGATADNVPGHPVYSNGFATTVGFRYFLRPPRLSRPALESDC